MTPAAIPPAAASAGRAAARGLGRVGRALGRRAARFARDEGGVVSVEAVLWLPLFFGFLMLVTDVSMSFYGRAQTFRLIQDTNRALSLGRYSTSAAAKTALEGAMASLLGGANRAQVTVSLSKDSKGQYTAVSTRVVIPIQNMMVFGAFGVARRYNTTVGSAALLERQPAS